MKKILFICAENAGRSQMAEAFFNFYAKENKLDWIAESNGTTPADKINPVVIEAMAEKDIDLDNAKIKKFNSNEVDQYEKIISFGCIVKSFFDIEIQNKIEEWHIEDPHQESLEKIRLIRDEIEKRIVNFIGEKI